MSLETILWGIFCMFVPFVNTALFWLYFWEKFSFEKIFTYKIWEKK